MAPTSPATKTRPHLETFMRTAIFVLLLLVLTAQVILLEQGRLETQGYLWRGSPIYTRPSSSSSSSNSFQTSGGSCSCPVCPGASSSGMAASNSSGMCRGFGPNAVYNAFRNKCDCKEKYSLVNGQCLSADQACEALYGRGAQLNEDGICECESLYVWYDSQCMTRSEYCRTKDPNASWDLVQSGCSCNRGYMTDPAQTTCIFTGQSKIPPSQRFLGY